VPLHGIGQQLAIHCTDIGKENLQFLAHVDSESPRKNMAQLRGRLSGEVTEGQILPHRDAAVKRFSAEFVRPVRESNTAPTSPLQSMGYSFHP
jgi:hypothetical protein